MPLHSNWALVRRIFRSIPLLCTGEYVSLHSVLLYELVRFLQGFPSYPSKALKWFFRHVMLLFLNKRRSVAHWRSDPRQLGPSKILGCAGEVRCGLRGGTVQSIGLLKETLQLQSIYPAGAIFACDRLLADAPHALRWTKDALQTDLSLDVSIFGCLFRTQFCILGQKALQPYLL